MKLSLAVLVYAAAMLLANLSAAQFGPAITPVNAFLLIGLDLALRDWLHMRLRPLQMLALIAATGAVTYLLNPAAQQIAIASAAAFTAAAAVDWLIFSALRNRSWLQRSNLSNIGAAAVDSILFPLLAWHAILPAVTLGQFAAKVLGGALWALVLARHLGRRSVAQT